VTVLFRVETEVVLARMVAGMVGTVGMVGMVGLVVGAVVGAGAGLVMSAAFFELEQDLDLDLDLDFLGGLGPLVGSVGSLAGGGAG
jgi:hypothetical protein